jgi:hypothetical protein
MSDSRGDNKFTKEIIKPAHPSALLLKNKGVIRVVPLCRKNGLAYL